MRLRLLLRLSLAFTILAVFLAPALLTSAQVAQGATMTVLRGEVAVVRPDGSSVQPAPSGTLVSVGDEIRTLSRSGALITFFVGTEIELGEDTILVVEAISRQGEQVDVSLRQVFGAAIHRVARFTDPGSSYRVNAGGAVTLVRGTEFLLLGPTPEGIVIIVCLRDCDQRSTFVGCPLGPYLGYYVVVEQGRVIAPCQGFAPDPAAGYWNAAFAAYTTALQDRQGDTDDRPPGQVPGGQQQEIDKDDDDQDEDESGPTATPTRTPRPTQTVTPTVSVTPTATPTSGPIEVSISDFSGPEGTIFVLREGVLQALALRANATDFTFQVNLSAPSSQTVTVDYATQDDTAAGDEVCVPVEGFPDYASENGTVTFTPGDTQETITIEVCADGDVESNEQFFVNLSNPVNAQISDGQAVGTIQNDDFDIE